MDVKEAVFWLLNFIGHTHQENETLTKALIYQKEKTKFSKKEFILPEKSIDNRYLYSYLMNERALSKEVVDYFVNKGLIYEEKNHHNIVFKGNDKTGVTRFASMRGVFDSKGNPKIDIYDEFGMCEHPYIKEGQSRRKDLKCIRHSKWTEIL